MYLKGELERRITAKVIHVCVKGLGPSLESSNWNQTRRTEAAGKRLCNLLRHHPI
jgi:hypothetical protein